MKTFKNFQEFANHFNNNEKCLDQLCQEKWGNGYQCRKCSHREFVKGRTWYYRRCQKCHYDESCTSNTLFHKIKFPIRNAFWICYQLSNHKKGISTLEIARQYGIHQETAWYFKRKVQLAMSQINSPSEIELSLMPIHLDTDEFKISGETFKPRSCSTSKSIVKKINPKRNKKGRETKTTFTKIEFDSHCTLGEVETLRAKNRVIKTEPISLSFKNLGDNQNTELFWYLHNLKNWMSAIHHRISLNHAHYYFSEFQYRFERRHRLKKSFPTLLHGMIENSSTSYHQVKAK